MKLFVWNINQRSSSGQKIPKFVNEVIMDSKADIVVLTEFIGTANAENIRNIQKFIDGSSLSEKYLLRYNTERKECEGSNGVLIAVKKEFEEKDDAKIISKIEKMNTARTEQPNFLQLDMAVNGRLISVIGTRIRVDSKKSWSTFQEVRREEYKERRVQLLSLIEHINTLENENTIVAGDFNHAFIRGDEKAGWSDDDVKKSYFGKDTYDTYNFHMMKDDFANIEMNVFTPEGEQYSHDFKLNDKKERLSDGYLKEDHIITKNLKVSNLKYCHSFIENNKDDIAWKQKWNEKKREYEYVIVPPYPDHAILTADVDI